MLERNLEKILDLVWLLILHYHIDYRSQQYTAEPVLQRKSVSKQSMLVWVNAVLYGRNITNFATDWSNGESLVALVNLCKPGLIDMDDYSNHPYERMSQAMRLAQKELNIPQVLSPDDLFVDQPDEASVMTYLSYFCRINSPGERKILHWVQREIPDEKVTNLTNDWRSGVSLGALVNKLTHNGFPQFRKMSVTTSLTNCRESMKQAKELLKIPSSISADKLSSGDLGYLAQLAYLVQFYAAQHGEPVNLKADIRKIEVSPVNYGEEEGEKIVWVNLDCSKAGQAKIHANVVTEAGKTIDVSVAEVDVDQYCVKFPTEDSISIYTLSIHYGGEEVNGSPFHVNLAAADASKVRHMGTEAPTAGKELVPVMLGFNTKEAGYGKLTAKASGDSAGSVPVELLRKPSGGFDVVFTPPIPDVYSIDVKWGKFVAFAKGQSCGTVPIELQQDSKRDFKLLFEPPTPDVYTVDVTWGGEPVPGSPFIINLLPPAKPDKVETGDPLFGGVGEMVDLPVDLTHAGSGELTAICRGSEVGDIKTSIIPISKKVHQVTFLASQMDIYYLSVFFDGVHIQGSPFHINLLQKLHGLHVPQPTYHKEIGTAMTVEVPSRDGDKRAKISVAAFGDVTGSCGTVVKKNAKGNYDVTLDPKVADVYTVDIQLNDRPIPERSFVVNYTPRIIPEPMFVQFTELDVKELCKRLFGTDSDVFLTISTHEAGKSVLEVSVDAPDNKQYEVELKSREDDQQTFDISYSPKVAGTHYLKILWDGRHIPNSPLPIRVVDYANVQNFVHGKNVSLDIDIPSDVKEKDIKVSVFHVLSGDIKIRGQFSKGKYRVTFTPKQSGLYCINVLIRDRELPSNPLVIRYGDSPRPHLCTVKDLPQQAIIGREVTFAVDSSNSGSGELYVKTSLRNLLKKDKSKVTWKESEDQTGVYVVTFTPASVGLYTLLITWAGKPISTAPHTISVVEAPPRVTVEMYTVGITKTREKIDPIPEIVKCSIGQALILRVIIPSKKTGVLTHIGKGLKSIFKDEVRAIANGEKCGPSDVKVKHDHDDTYEVVFTPRQPDKYVLSIQYEDQEIVNPPITALFVQAPTDSSKVEVTGLGERDVVIGCFIKQELKFDVSTTGAGVGTIRVEVEAPEMKGHPVFSVSKESNHRYCIRYLPLTTGRHLLHLLWDETAIPRSPITIDVKEPTDVLPGHSANCEISSGKWKLRDIKVTGTHLDTGRKYEVKKMQKKGKFLFSLQPDEPGTYEIALRVEGIDICRPFQFKFEQPSLPHKVVVFDFKEEGTINFPIKFKVDVSEAGIGPLKIDIDDSAGKAKTSISDCEDGVHTIHFSASSPGNYRLNITWNGVEVPNSPFDIKINAANVIKKHSHHGDSNWKLHWPRNRQGTPDSSDGEDILEELEDTFGQFISWIFGGSDTKGTTEIATNTSPSKPTSPSSGEIIQTGIKDLNKAKEVRLNIGRPSRWVIDVTELDGQLEVTATGSKTGAVDVLLTQVRERVFQATFRPTKPDRYTISVLLNGKHMPNSPMFVNYELPKTNVKSIKIAGLKKIPNLISVGQKIHVIVDTQDAGLGEFVVDTKAPLLEENTHTLEIENFDDNPAVYDVAYIPHVVGLHSLELLFSKIMIPGSPLKLKVCDPQKVSFSFATKSTIKIGQLIRMQCDTSKAGYDDLTATCVGTNCGEVAVSITNAKDKSKHDISFQPEVEDLYILEVMLGPYHIRGSPFKINLSPIQIEKVVVTGPLQPEGPQGPIKLIVNTGDLQRGNLVSVCKYKEETVSVKTMETSPNVFSLVFQPEEAAHYIWSVKFHGQHVPGSPFRIDTTPHPEKATVIIPEQVGIGQHVCYEIDVSGAGMGRITATCKGKKAKKIPVEITPVRQSVFGVSFLPLSYDTYTLYVQWSGREILNSPFVYELKPPQHQAGTEYLEIPILLPQTEDLSAVDVSCTGEKYGDVAVKLTSVSANKYCISFKSQGPDLYTLSVVCNGLQMKGSPFSVDLRVSEDGLYSDDEEDCLLYDGDENGDDNGDDNSNLTKKSKEHEIQIGSALVIRVRPQRKDQKNGEVKATAAGKQTGVVTIHVEKFSEEYYQVTFNPKKPDTYTINVTFNGDPIPRSPFVVHYYEPPPCPSKVQIIGLQDIQSILDVNKEITVVINATKAGNGTFRAEVKGPNDPKVEVRPRDDEPGMYSVSFFPTIGGTFILSLFWNEEHIPNSPMKLQVVDSSIAKRYLPGKDITTDDFEIQCSPTDITAYAVKRDVTTRLEVNVKQVNTHLYRFIFSHNDPGFYFIHILTRGMELPISPIPIYIAKQTQPQKCVVKNIPSVAYLNEEITIVVDCSEGGEGSLQTMVVGPNGSEKYLLIDALDNENGRYTVTFVPSTEGTHFLYISWSGQAIHKSPYQLEVRKQTQEELPVSEVSIVDLANQSHTVTGGGEMTIASDHYFSFSVRLTEKMKSKFTARAVSKDGKYFDFTLVESLNNLFKYAFKPPSPGQYFLEFCLGDLKLKLPQLPSKLYFIEPAVDAAKVKVLKHTISGLLLVNRKIFFQVDTRLAGNGHMEVKLEGPSIDAANLCFDRTPDKPGFYDVSFTPVETGVYHLELLWGGTILPGFPLVLSVVKPNIKHGESSSFEISINSHAKDITSFAINVKTGERIKVQLHQVSKRRYRFKFRPKQSGTYNLHVLVGKEEIAGSPFPFICGQPSQPWNVIITNLDSNVQVNSMVKFIINALKAGDGVLNIRVRGPDSERVPKLHLQELNEGIYEADFTPRATGLYSVQITWSGKEIPNSPFQVSVTEGGTLIPEVCDGPSVDKKTTAIEHSAMPPSIQALDLSIFGRKYNFGKILSFRVVHFGFPESLGIQSRGPKDLSIKTIKGPSVNTYEINAEAPGKYELDLLWKGDIVKGGPYILHFQMPRTICGLDWQNQVFRVGKPYQCIISTNDISPGVMEISCEPHDAAEIVLRAVKSNEYLCSIIPKQVGDFRINVCYNGFQIQGSPFVVHFKDATSFNVNFNLQAESLEVGDISAVLESTATQQAIPISLQQLFGGECNLEFLPTEGDEYTLTITCGLKIKKELIVGSPFHLTYLPLENNASMCHIEGAGITSGVLGEWSKFVMKCEDAGQGKLTAAFDGEGAEVRMVPLQGNKYEIQYCISIAGEYQLRVQWGGEDIQGSPFHISAKSTTSTSTSMSMRVSLSGTPREVKATESIEFDVKMQASGTIEDLTVEASTASGSKVTGKLTPTGENCYHVTIPTSEPGDYSINLYYKGISLLQQSLTVTVRDPGESLCTQGSISLAKHCACPS